jgi:hypothetical protein
MCNSLQARIICTLLLISSKPKHYLHSFDKTQHTALTMILTSFQFAFQYTTSTDGRVKTASLHKHATGAMQKLSLLTSRDKESLLPTPG